MALNEYDTPMTSLAALPMGSSAVQPITQTPPQPAAPLIVEKDVPEQLKNDLMYITRLTSPTGEVVRAAPEDIDGLISAGYKPVNLEKTWEVTKFNGQEPVKVRGGDLQSYIQQGYKTNKLDEYIQQKSEYMRATAPQPVELSAAETVGGLVSAAASGATFGLTDVAARGLNEMIEAVGMQPEGYAKEQANQLREIRDALGWGSIAAEVLGGLLTGGAIASAGKTAATKIGLSALEGIAGGIGNQAARQALEDPRVTVESYLSYAALGGGIGGAGGALAAGLGRKLPTAGLSEVPIRKLDLGDLASFKDSREFAKDVLAIKDEAGNLLGTATVSRADPSSYHLGGRHGVTIEDFHISPKAPADVKQNLVRELVEQFGSVSSPSNKEALAGGVRDLFSTTGVKHVTKDGAEWFQATADTLPKATSQDAFAMDTYRKIMRVVGKEAEEGSRDFELMKKLTNNENGIFRKDVLDMIGDPTKKINEVMKDFKDIDDISASFGRAADDTLRGLAEKITPDAALAMKQVLSETQAGMANTIRALKDSGTDAGAFYANMLTRKSDGLNKVIKTASPQDAWFNLNTQRREFVEAIANLNKKGNMPSGVSDGLNAIVGRFDEALEKGFSEPAIQRVAKRVVNVGPEPEKLTKGGKISEKWKAWNEKKVKAETSPVEAPTDMMSPKWFEEFGEDVAEGAAKVADSELTKPAQLYKKLIQYSQEIRDANEEFGKLFRTRGKIAQERVYEAYQSTKPGKMNSKLDALDRFRASAQTFNDTLKEARASGLVDNLPNSVDVDFISPLNNVLKTRELSETAALLTRMGANTAREGMIKSAAATLGSMIGAGVGSIGGPFSAGIASMSGSNLASALTNSLTNPTALLKLSMSMERTTSRLGRTLTKAIDTTGEAITKIQRPTILAGLGITRENAKTPVDYVRSARERLEELKNPERVAMTVGGMPEEVKAQTQQSLDNIYGYSLANLPNPKPGRGVSQADAMKADKILLAAVNPVAALERAVANKETDVVKHVAAMYPGLMQVFQTMMLDKAEDISKLPYAQRLNLQRIAGYNASGSSDGAGRLSQGVFAARREEEAGGSEITPPAETVSSSLMAK